MRIKMLPGALVIAALVTLAISLGVATPNVYGGGDDTLPTLPEKPELKYPNLGSNLDQLVASVEKGETSAKEAAEDAPVHQEASVAVTIYLSGNLDDVVKFLEDNGGSPRNVGEDYIEAYVPVTLLGQVSERPGVIRVREIVPPEPAQSAQQIAGHGPPVHGSTAWNQAGFGGQGVKVGVIDTEFSFNDFRGLMGTEFPSSVQARCYTDVGRFTSNLSNCGNALVGNNHGTLLAEAVMDIAPEASLYIATPWSLGDLQTATDWMVSQGVSVIVHGVTHSFDGPGDGTSPFSDSPLKTVDRAVAGGIVWVNSAGNYYQSTWFGTYPIVTSGSSRFLVFDGTDVFNDLTLDSGGTATVQLRWEDSWQSASRDLNLIIWDRDALDIVEDSFDLQSGQAGQVPFEALTCRYPCDGRYAVVVSHYSGSAPGWIQLIVGGDVGSIEYYTGNGSIRNPAESANPGMLAVGAAHWSNVRTIEPYSSRGPTPDGRVKPDIVGADCGATALRPLNQNQNGFCGTSQSAPHIAGMAALVRQRFPTYTAVQVANYLKEHAEQRESPDPNNTWGHGFAQLPPLSECSDAVPSAASNPGLVANCEALLAARDTLAGSGTLNWSGSTAIGSWDGVTVDGSPPRVTKLNLRDSQLTGTIPPELGGLASLAELSLGDNRLTGPIPAWLGGLTNLERLSLSQNQLSGAIPTELGSLSKLQVLYLWGNQLTGPIPLQLASLTNLEILALGGNQLTGMIPAELGRLTNLRELWLYDNQLTEMIPAELGRLTNLRELWLYDNQLTGMIPAELGSLSKLQVLHLWGNQLTGPIPLQLASLTNLERLSLSQNQLSGAIPTELGSLSKLQVLYLWGNQLTGPIPLQLASLTNLEILALGGNQLTGPIPAWLGRLTNLRELWLYDNQLTGMIPTELGSLSKLQVLYLWGNQLTGPIPASLGDLVNLQVLSLWDNRLTGPIPASLGGLANLERLSLSQNQLTGTIPSELGSLSKLEILALGGNQLTGPIPAWLGNLTNLRELWLNYNQLTGMTPAELGSLDNLEVLSLSGNELTGPIPPQLASLTNLEILALGGNQLSGPVPIWLGGLANLEQLSLSQNQLTGEIPPELGSLSNLEILALGGNQLTGEIPPELGSLSNLEILALGGNQLTGEIPTELGSLAMLEQLDLSENELSGEIPLELGSLTALMMLRLNDNGLTGSMPAGLGNLSNLEELNLSSNQLTGEIPSLSRMINLKVLVLHDNHLTGTLPSWLGDLTNLTVLSIWGNQLTGPIPPELSRLTNLERLSLSQNMLTGCVPEAWRDIAESDVLELGLPFCAVSLNTAPVFSDSEGNPITEAVRSVVENTAAGENVGAPVTAMDADNDTLTYSLGGTDMASFDIDPATGQIMVGAGTMLDYETKASYMVTVTATDPDSASDMITVTITVTNEEETGEVTLWAGMDALTMAPQVGDTITGAVMDPDGGVTGETWQWSRTMDDMDSRDMDSWVDIEDATDDEYTVMEGDRGYYLRVMATYMDAVGTDTAMEYSIPTMMVGAMAAEMTLLERYDDGDDGWIQLEEARVAVGDYFFKPKGSKLSLEDARKVIGLYFDYKNRQQ